MQNPTPRGIGSRIALALALATLMSVPAARAQIGVQTVKLGYEDENGQGTLTVVPIEHPQNATDPAPYRAQFVLEKGGIPGTGAGIYQYLPSNQNYLLAFAMPIEGRVLFFQGRTFPDPNNTGIAGGGTYFPLDHPDQAKSWDITTSGAGTGTGTGTGNGTGTGMGTGTGEGPTTKQTAQLLTLLNQYRQSNGLPALTRVKELDNAAAGHAIDMAKHQFLSTRGSDGSALGDRLTRAGYAWRAGGELVGMTATLSADAVFASLTGSLGGRQLLLSASFTECGLAEVDLVDNQYYWCIDLAAR